MRSFITFILLCALFILENQNIVYSQDEKAPMLMWVLSERALPDKVFEYEDAQKNANEFLKKYFTTIQWYTYSSENDTYYYITNINSLDDITKFYQEAIKVSTEQGPEYQKVTESFRNKLYSNNQEIYIYDKEGSYIPKETRVKPEEAGFQRWTIFEFYPNYDQAALTAVSKEMKDFFEKNNITEGYDIYNKYFGGNSNISVMIQNGKNRIDYFTNQNELVKKYWEQMKPLYLKYMSFVKDYQLIDVWFRKDLSIMKEKAK